MADHQHSHEHHHHEGDSYFINQLCMVGLSGAFGVICLCLWFLQNNMLNVMLAPQFHLYVLLSGIVLTAMALARGAILWSQSRDPDFLRSLSHHHHDHGHAHDHDHAHEHAIQEKLATHQSVQSLPVHSHGVSSGHEHKPGEACAHDHAHHDHAHHDHAHHDHAHHAHAHAPGHQHHDHDEADHDHGWAPWRYVVILVPIILFLLGLPNKPPALIAKEDRTGAAMQQAEAYLLGIGMGPDPLVQLVHFGVALRPSGEGEPVDYRTLERMADDADRRGHWKDKVVAVRGQYMPIPGNEQIFMLVRLKISCCAADATQLDVPMVSRESVQGLNSGDWVRVTGRVDFRQQPNGAYKTVVFISQARDIVPCDPDPNPYIW